jgi:peptide deformylase
MGIDPAQLSILRYPDPMLRRKAAPIETVDEAVRTVVRRMIELMYDAEGVGLAAPQVGVPWRLFVTLPPEADREREPLGSARVYINPGLEIVSKELEVHEEGCLSLPNIHVDIRRPVAVTITAQDLEGRTFSETRDDFMARVWQHEFDHLNGVLIIDRMSPMDRIARRKDIKDLERASRL